ncbi:MAG: BMP family ABC transporter substrate-binding protein [Oscillibacter sp.]
MKKFLALLLSLVMVMSLAACGEKPAPAAPEAPAEPAANADFKIGLICVHDENSGYDLAHIEGIKGAMKELGLSESQITFKYNIPEDDSCYDNAVDLAESGCNIIFSDSYGHQSYMQEAASEFPEITFVACTGDTAATSGLANLKNMFPSTYESRYVSGIAAGMKLKELLDAGTVKDAHVGYVGAFPYAEVVCGYTAFFLGIRSIVPDAHMDVTYTNSWYDPTAEAEAANFLVSKGCVIIGQHADSTGAPAAVEALLDSGKVAYSVGYNIDMLTVAPKAALTSAQNNWVALYTPVLKAALEGTEIPTDTNIGYANGGVMISKLGESCAAGTQEAVDAAWAAIKDGSLQIFDTKTFTVEGKQVTSAFAFDTDGDFVNDAEEAIKDGVFVESTLRSAPYFSLRIDGITELAK